METSSNSFTKVCPRCENSSPNHMSFCVHCGGQLPSSNERIINCNFEFQCPLQWTNLDNTENEDIKFCRSCNKNVYFAHTQKELNELSLENKCIAYQPFQYVNNLDYVSKTQPLMGIPSSNNLSDESTKPKLIAGKENRSNKVWWKFWK